MKTPRFHYCPAIPALAALVLAAFAPAVSALSEGLNSPKIHFPKSYDEARAEKLGAVIRSEKFRYLGGLTSYWEPEWSTTLVYEGDAAALNAMLAGFHAVEKITVRVTFSPDLAKETGSALQAGSWWVMYSHTSPDTVTVRVNLAADGFKGDKLELILPK